MDKGKNFSLRGDIAYSKSLNELSFNPDSYLVCINGVSAGVFSELPEEYKDLEVVDYRGKLIIPGLCDLHVHAPQFAFRGLGTDMELLDWLDTYTFPEEAKYADVEYADRAYDIFVDAISKGFTTRACVFGTIHTPATLLLMNKLESSGLQTYVGRVNMDRNSPDNLREESAAISADATRQWLEASKIYKNTMPIITPRFVPSCSDELMGSLGEIHRDGSYRIQSHLSENLSEVEWVKELAPESKNYADAYDRYSMLGEKNRPAIMAHCVHTTDEEQLLMKERGAYVALCPISNTNLSSGIAPARRYLDIGINMGLGTDIAGGFDVSMLRVMSETIMSSKLYWRLVNNNDKPLSLSEVFYLATIGGGSFFGKVGSFDSGYEADAVVVDDADILAPRELSLAERLERLVYLGKDTNVAHKYVQGRRIR